MKKGILGKMHNYFMQYFSGTNFDGIPNGIGAEKIRRKIYFYGTVQQVGFRLETQFIAQRIGITGSASNLPDGSVVVELQGSEEQIEYCLFMISQVKRFHLTKITKENMPVLIEEKGFICR